MATRDQAGRVEETARSLALEGFRGAFGSKADAFPKDRIWAAFRELGSMLWLDTGDLEEASRLWTSEFTHLTTNNTLVNKEVQKGLFDELIPEAAARLRSAQPGMDLDELVLEVGFILNCRVALRLVEAFDAHVSVELHPGAANDVQKTLHLARRYYAVCPERFIVKVPLTPSGYLAVRQLSREGIPINYTLGFSARQNYLAAVISKPRYVNVFMGRLNQFVADSGLGDGKLVGEKVTLATQLALWRLRDDAGEERSRLIGASTRDPQQVIDLAGLDVFTLPTKVAAALHERLERNPVRLACCAHQQFEVQLAPGVRLQETGLATLWELPDQFCRMARRLAEDQSALSTPETLVHAVAANGFANLLRNWTREELQQIREDGKIPKFDRWRQALGSGELGLDDLMSASALQSFAIDQQELDDRIRRLVE